MSAGATPLPSLIQFIPQPLNQTTAAYLLLTATAHLDFVVIKMMQSGAVT